VFAAQHVPFFAAVDVLAERRSTVTSAKSLWKRLEEDLFSLFDEAADHLERLECPEQLFDQAPRVVDQVLARVLLARASNK
jgi:hypothetical protein